MDTVIVQGSQVTNMTESKKGDHAKQPIVPNMDPKASAKRGI